MPLANQDVEKTINTDRLERVQSPAEILNEKAGAQVPTAPVIDGGRRAWLQVVGSCIVFGNVWGVPFAFGSFQSYYELNYLRGISPSSISWIGTVSSFLLIVTGVFTGPMFDLGYFRTMLFIGALVGTLGIMMLSLCTEYWQILLTQGVLLGLGNGFLFLPGLALVGRSFQKRRAIAMGITSCGAPAGGVIYTLVFQQLITRVGFGWTVRVMGFIMLGSYLIAFPFLLWGAKNIGDIGTGTKRKLLDKTAFTDLPFWSYTFANFFVFCGYLIPFFYMPSYGQVELGMSPSLSLNSIITAQAASIVGRMAAAVAANYFGVMIPWITCAFCSGLFCLVWIAVHDVGSFIAFSALYGAFSGALIPLPPSIFPVVCPDPKVLGTRLGMAQSIGAIASLVGAPIAGALSKTNTREGSRNYLGLQLFSGLALMLGAVQLVGLWALLIKKRASKRLV